MKILVGKASFGVIIESRGMPQGLMIQPDGGCIGLFVDALLDIASLGIANLLCAIILVATIGQPVGIYLGIDDLGRLDSFD